MVRGEAVFRKLSPEGGKGVGGDCSSEYQGENHSLET